MAAAVLTIDINARLAGLEQGLAQANRRLGSFKSQVDGIGNSLKNAFGALGIGAAVVKFEGLIKGAIDGADHLNDLSKATGVAAVTLGGIGFAAQQSGSSLDEVAKSFGKLNLQVAAAAAGNPVASEAFDKLGIKVRESNGVIKSADVVLIEIAQKMEQYSGGANTAALANQFFKKGYQELLPLLRDGAESLRQNIAYYVRYSGVTDDLVKNSDKFNDTLAKLNLLNAAFFNQLAGQLLPTLQGYAEALVGLKEKSDGYKTSAAGLADTLKNLAEFAIRGAVHFHTFGIAVGGLAAKLEALSHGDFKRIETIGALVQKDMADERAKLDKFFETVNNPPPGVDKPKGKKPDAPGLTGDGGAAQKRALDVQLRALDDAIRDEQKLMGDREKFLAAYYQDDEIGLREYFNMRRTITATSLDAEVSAYDEQIRKLNLALGRGQVQSSSDREIFGSAKSAADRVKAEGDIAEALRKRANLEESVALKGVDLFFEERRAVKAFNESIEQTSIALAGMRGDTVAAAAAAFDFATRQQRDQLRLNAGSGDEGLRRQAEIGQRLYDQLRARTIAQAELNKASDDFGQIVERLGITQARIDIARQSGSLTELEALRAQGNANLAMIPALQRQVELYQEIADRIGDPKAQLAADQLRLKIEQLGAAGDLVGKKFTDVFVTSLGDALAAATEKGAKLKDILANLEKSIVGGISKIVGNNLAETAFKPDGPLGGIGKFFGDLFGGKAKAGGAVAGISTGPAAADAALSTLATTSTLADTSLSTLATTAALADTSLATFATTNALASTSMATLAASAGAAAAALTAMAASSAASSIGSKIPFGDLFEGLAQGGGLAGGTDYWKGGWTPVGEHGPELLKLPRGSKVVPSEVSQRMAAGGAGPSVVNVTLNLPPGMQVSRATAGQLAGAAATGVRRAKRNQ